MALTEVLPDMDAPHDDAVLDTENNQAVAGTRPDLNSVPSFEERPTPARSESYVIDSDYSTLPEPEPQPAPAELEADAIGVIESATQKAARRDELRRELSTLDQVLEAATRHAHRILSEDQAEAIAPEKRQVLAAIAEKKYPRRDV